MEYLMKASESKMILSAALSFLIKCTIDHNKGLSKEDWESIVKYIDKHETDKRKSYSDYIPEFIHKNDCIKMHEYVVERSKKSPILTRSEYKEFVRLLGGEDVLKFDDEF